MLITLAPVCTRPVMRFAPKKNSRAKQSNPNETLQRARVSRSGATRGMMPITIVPLSKCRIRGPSSTAAVERSSTAAVTVHLSLASQVGQGGGRRTRSEWTCEGRKYRHSAPTGWFRCEVVNLVEEPLPAPNAGATLPCDVGDSPVPKTLNVFCVAGLPQSMPQV